ncbi:ArsC/Spx/MgsR family protein [Marinifilum fragile]|uniref:arsenate reductase family protein n=1 Tax=Marinifilum fragile TaxID=570161 RepID=UPI002AA73CCD|nr:ArsC/Spx/MgsR family protein [Marinifilum fragile]
MKKIYHLSSCTTCQRIIKELDIDSDFELQDIKTQKISADQLEEMKNLSGSYESLFSRRAIKYKELGLKEKVLSEDDYRDYILSEYTFLKRPVLLIDGAIFVGNAKKTVENAKKALGK